MTEQERRFSLGDPKAELSQATVEKTVASLKEQFPNGFTLAYLSGEQFHSLNGEGTITTDGEHINIFDWGVEQPVGGEETISMEKALEFFLKSETVRYLDYCHSMDVWDDYGLTAFHESLKASGEDPPEYLTPALVFIDHAIDSRDWIKIEKIEIKREDVHSVIQPSPQDFVDWYAASELLYDKKFKKAIEYTKREHPEIKTDEEAERASIAIRTNIIGNDSDYETTDELIGVMIRNFLVKISNA